MTARMARALAWGMWIIGATCIVGGSALAARYPAFSILEPFDAVANFVWSGAWLGFGLVGALIVSQRPRNLIGWVLCGITFCVGLAAAGPSYGRAAATPGNALPLGDLATWIGAWAFTPTISLVVLLLLLFPSATLPTRRQRILGGTLVAVMVVGMVLAMVTPGPVEGDAPPLNPLGIEAWASPIATITGFLSTVVALVAVGTLADLVYRFWRSRGVERQQFRWLALAACAFPVLFFLAILVEEYITGPRAFDPVVIVVFAFGNGMAAAVGIAVTRYGLYEINRVVSRTVGYALLTAVLVSIYLAAVTLLTAATAPITRKSPVAVAAATLLAAAVFGPARRTIQGAVDRRFNRARYDASRTVEAYRLRLREEVDLDALSRDLLATVRSSMQPAGAAVWLRGANEPRSFPHDARRNGFGTPA